ncbi:MAG: hypothetical protein WDN67_03940 [Candidatus Moraniibacteriota bacterium]
MVERALAPDPARTVSVPSGDGQNFLFSLHPNVFRALVVRSDGMLAVYSAVLNPTRTAFVVLLPPGSESTLRSGWMAIVSNDGRYLLTPQGESIDLRETKGIKLRKGRMSQDFLVTHPAPLPPVVTLTRSDPETRVFWRDLEALFPERLRVNGTYYSGSPYVKEFLAAYTPLNSFGDRAVTCGQLRIGGIDPASAGIGAAVSFIASLPSVLKKDCLAGKRQEKHHETSQRDNPVVATRSESATAPKLGDVSWSNKLLLWLFAWAALLMGFGLSQPAQAAEHVVDRESGRHALPACWQRLARCL